MLNLIFLLISLKIHRAIRICGTTIILHRFSISINVIIIIIIILILLSIRYILIII
jgi:hypothetical protein